MITNSKEAILQAATRNAQAHGYTGLNFRDLADEVGIAAASIYHYFPNKAKLGEAVAKRYCEDTKIDLEAILKESSDPKYWLRQYPNRIFRKSLESNNRLCLGSFMSAEYDDLPDGVKTEVQAFADINVAWLSKVLSAAGVPRRHAENHKRARAIFAAVAGAQLMARSRADIALFDALIESYRSAGPIPS